ncbi:MAG: sugar-binding domain-containing protein [Eubacterium sp.]|nr:sugar-binding domain-containing protein [Eubacterium sp.]
MKEKELMRIISAAKMYYEQNMTQAQIAQAMGISRPSVSNLLGKARQEGIVKIEIQSFGDTSLGKGRELRERFGLKSCRVVPAGPGEQALQETLYREALDFLLSLLPKTKILGLGWGYNISRIVDILAETAPLEGTAGKICPLIGTATIPHRGYHPNELVTDFARATGFEAEFLISPAFPATKQERDIFSTTDNYNSVLALWKRADTALVTLGGYPCVPDQATAYRFGRRLITERATSNILSYFFDVKGGQVSGEDDYAMQIPLQFLKKIRNFIGIAPVGGSVAAVIGCLNTGMVKHLIIDEVMAERVLKSKP